MTSYVIEPVKERLAKILRSFIEAVLRDVLARVVPDPFGRIQFRPVGRKWQDFDIATVCLEPVMGLLLLMIRSIVLHVLHQINPVAAAGRRAPRPAPGRPNRFPTENNLPGASK